MTKIKIWDDGGKQPLHIITYNETDIDDIAIAEQERRDMVEKYFKVDNLKSVYVQSCDEDGAILSSKVYHNPNYQQIDVYVFIVCRNNPIVKGVYKTLEGAKRGMIAYYTKTHAEYETDEIVEIVDELVHTKHYEIDGTKYTFTPSAVSA